MMPSGLIARCWLLVLVLLSACGQGDSQRILGHWRAEQFQVQGLSVPMGPEFVVSRNELRSPGGEVSIPLSSISAKGDTVTLNVMLGLGLNFRFESSDRISFEIPLLDGQRLYYRRVVATPSPDSPTGDRPAAPQDAKPEPATTASQSVERPGSAGMIDYNQAVLHMRQGDADAAVRSLRDAFAQGFRDFQRLEASQDLAPLKTDPRYQALVTRYR